MKAIPMRSSLAVSTSFALTLALALSSAALAAPPKKASKEPEPPPLPDAPVRLWLIAPTTRGPWQVRIDNEGTIPLRIPADARLLKLEIETGEKDKPTKCEAPKALRPESFPESRALLLGPGQSYVETIDPFLYCFGKDAAAIRGGALVHARFGWDPPKKRDKKKPPKGPFAAESTEREPTIAPLEGVVAPSIVLGADAPVASAKAEPSSAPADAAKPGEPAEGEAPKPFVDERAGRLALTAKPFVDASGPRAATIEVTAKNEGLRPITVALRPWMLSFQIEGPYGAMTSCPGDPPRGLPRDAFRKLEPGASTSFTVLLAEVCPRTTFPRPGIYRVTSTLSAGETTSGVEAYTAEVSTTSPTLIRMLSAPEAFHVDPPRALPAKAPEPDADADAKSP